MDTSKHLGDCQFDLDGNFCHPGGVMVTLGGKKNPYFFAK